MMAASRQHSHVGTSGQHSHVGTSRQHSHVGTSRQHSHVGTSRQHSHVGTSRQHSHVGRLVLGAAALLVLVVSLGCGAEARAQGRNRQEKQIRNRRVFLSGQMHSSGSRPAARRPRSQRPNIVLIMTDDQDVLLGSLKAMPKLQEYMTDRGAFFNNMFVSTPMCCPSRSSILTGLYVHNHNVYTNNDNCSSSQWVRDHEPRTFAAYLQQAGYKTGYFGKYLNKYNGTYAPTGWTKWVGLVRNSRFYNYTLSYDGQLQRHYDNYYKDYLTDRIANDSVAFFKRTKRHYPSQPVLMVLSVPAPHGPEDAAPQYQHMFVNNTDHRTPSWNLAPNTDKQWLLQQTQPMTPQFKIFTDLLQRRRLQTLQSVDDLIVKVYHELDMLGELDNTYVLYTSDHGYHLGQFGLIKGKSMAYDFDTRVPLIITGPGIQPGSKISNMAANVDLAPTLLEMGGLEPPPHMDGQSLLPLLKATHTSHSGEEKSFIKSKKPWRDSILLERGKVSKRMLKLRMKEEKLKLMLQNQKNLHLYLPPKQQKILRKCSGTRKDYQLPCTPGQKWFCQKDPSGLFRLHKCRHADRDRGYHGNTVLLQQDQAETCVCRDGTLGLRLPSHSAQGFDRPRHRRFLHRSAKRKARSRLVRQRRSLLRDSFALDSNPSTVHQLGPSTGFELFTRRCRILSNSTVSCDQDIYQDYSQWENHRERVDEMIKEYKKILEDLRNIREHLLDNRPPLYVDTRDVDNNRYDDDDDVIGDEFDMNSGDRNCLCEAELSQNRDLDRQTVRRLQRQLRKEQKLQRRALRREERQQRRDQKRGRKKKSCNGDSMKCFSHDNDHWKTPPYWLYGPFCFCSNANNNTYWCIRTVNATNNFLYCEYITDFIAYYDMTSDPHQLNNVAKRLNYGILQQLHDQLAMLKACRGKEACDLHNLKDSRMKIDRDWRQLASFEDRSGSWAYEDDYGDSFDFDEEPDPDFF